MELNEDQRVALEAAKSALGRTWKSKLRHMWMDGMYDRYGMGDHSCELQQVRNQFGPTWLDRYATAALSSYSSIREESMTDVTDVIFRKWRNANVIALFPGVAYDRHGVYCSSYEHVGQHGAASMDLAGPYQGLDAAKPHEYAELKRELEGLGYVLKVVKRATRRHRLMRMGLAPAEGKGDEA